jgi:hypothetical protein
MASSQAQSHSAFERVLAGLMAVSALVSLLTAMKYARYPVQYNYEEGNLLNAGVRIASGQTPYPDPHSWPLVLNPYGPLPYLATAAIIKTFGVSLTGPRILAIGCASAIAVLIGLLLRRHPSSWPLSIVFASLFLMTPLVRYWLPIWRVDWLALALSLAGLTLFAWYPRRWLVVPMLLVASLFVKYTFLAAPAAVGLCLMLRKDWGLLLRYAATGVVSCVAGFTITQWCSNGHFAFHEFGTHVDTYELSRLGLLLTRQVEDLPALFGLAFLSLFMTFRRGAGSLAVVYLLMTLIGSSTAGKLGSSSNHLIELTAAACLGAGTAWAEIVEFVRRRRGRPSGPALNAIWAGVCASVVIPGALYRPPAAGADVCAGVQAFLRQHGDRVLTDNVGELLLARKPVAVSNPFVYTQLVVRGGWSDAPVLDRVGKKQFDVILLEEAVERYRANDRFSADVLNAIKGNYRRAAQFECPYAGVAYVPRE